MSWGVCSYVKTMDTKDVFQEDVYDPNTGGSLMVTVSPLLDENSKFIGAVLVAKDITEYKNLQAQLLHTEKLAAVGELASGVAHELNNPLCGIMGFSELLLEREKDEKKKSTLAKMLNEAQRAQKIIQNLLSFVRANKQEMMPVEVNKIILDTLDLKEHEFKNNNIDVIKRLSDSLPKINGNFMQLQQVVLNMLTNAQMALLEANKDRKEIVIETRIKGDDNMVEILIKDNGNGIAPQHLSKIFNPFFTTKEAGKGTGLGLSISYGIIKEHNGRIYAESKVGEGAEFYIELPVGTV
jgi:signal transduction histidine kinase